jgi:protein SCO1/2
VTAGGARAGCRQRAASGCSVARSPLASLLLLAAAAGPALAADPAPADRRSADGTAASEQGAGAVVVAADEPDLPREDERIYARVFDAELTDAAGAPRRLSELWRRRPLIVTLVFARCALICPPYLRSLARAVDAVGGAGEQFDVVVLSFDPRDTPEEMAALAVRLGLDGEPGWTFGTTSPAAAAGLADSIGAWVRWDPAGVAADHPAMLAAVDGGRLVRLLVGATVPPRRLREVVWELRHELVPSYPLPSERVLFRCFRYRPETGGVAVDWGFLLLLAPGAGMLLGTLAIFGGRPARV